VAELGGTVAVCAAGFGCGALLGLRAGVLSAGAIAVSLALLGTSLVPLLLITLAPWTAGRLVRSRRELVAALAGATASSRPSRPRWPSWRCAGSARGSRASCTTSSPTTSR
jgi:hypothetical protein